MSTAVCVFVGMVIRALLAAWRARRTAARAEAREAVLFRVGANLPDEGRRYSLGRVLAGGEFRWIPRWSWTRLRRLPAELRYVRAREATFREMVWLPIGVLVIECESPAGPVRLWARREHVVLVAEMIRRTGTPSPNPNLSIP
ncbi:hypothetical protein [Streptomyces sp. NBC_00401]|uniref:hypothetical protein n=1 Tax=Streptomyces sp. NBC_00401 TaxID=2975738 RepID=UPI0022502FC0|nr:hypothetical protein [Streptomyces sp. NBC_00401]MCX5083104.1 hypothetical protein [Streptomyces sp. NBC_00401]